MNQNIYKRIAEGLREGFQNSSSKISNEDKRIMVNNVSMKLLSDNKEFDNVKFENSVLKEKCIYCIVTPEYVCPDHNNKIIK